MLRKVDDTHVPLSAYLGPVGMPGVTAWYGLNKIIAPKAGETVVVSAASGAVGSVVGQLAKLAGARAVGIAGGADKCRYVVETLGFDACVDYKAGNLYQDLKAVTPNGVDGYFENVGGEVLDVTLARMNAFGRIALCGMIAGYDGQPMPLKHPSLMLTQRLLVQGFIVSEHMERVARSAQATRHAGRAEEAAISRDASRKGSKRRPRRSSACSRARTSASSSSS